MFFSNLDGLSDRVLNTDFDAAVIPDETVVQIEQLDF